MVGCGSRAVVNGKDIDVSMANGTLPNAQVRKNNREICSCLPKIQNKCK